MKWNGLYIFFLLLLGFTARGEVEVKEDSKEEKTEKPPLMGESVQANEKGLEEKPENQTPEKPELAVEAKNEDIELEEANTDELEDGLLGEEKIPMPGPTNVAVSGPLEPELPPLPALNDAMFRVREYEGDIELLTPWGNFVIPGEFGKRFGKDHFRFSINVRDLMPEVPDPPTEEEKKDEEEDPAKLLAQEDDSQEGKTDPESPRTPTAIPQGNPLVTIDDSDRLIVDANRLFNQRRYYEALTVVDSLLRKIPDNSRAWLMRGSLMMVQGHKDLAMKSYEQALKLSPDDPEIRAIVERYK